MRPSLLAMDGAPGLLCLALGRSPADPWAHFHHWTFGRALALSSILPSGPPIFALLYPSLSIPFTELHSSHFSFILVANCAVKKESIEGNSAIDGSCSFIHPFFLPFSLLRFPSSFLTHPAEAGIRPSFNPSGEICWLLSLFSHFPHYSRLLFFALPPAVFLIGWLAHLLLFAGQWTQKNPHLLNKT